MKWLPTYLKATAYPFEVKLAASQNENSRHAVDLGMDVGEPDLRFYCRPGDILHMFYLELKKKKGKLSESQIEWNVDFDANYAGVNATRAVAYGFLEAREKIISWLNSLPRA